MLGNEIKQISTDEKEMIKVARRGVISIINIKKGETFTEKNISIMRPCIGIGADKINQVIGKKSTKNIKINTPITFSMLK